MCPRLPTCLTNVEDYRRALNRLYALGPGKMLPGRERLAKLLEDAGNPQLAMPTVLVGGTNGKGSLVAGLSAVLSSIMPTGAFLKPHLKSIRERWRINDQTVSTQLLTSSINRACDLIEQHGTAISFFEANVLVGALCFAESGCKAVVWEVGLGGAQDACNLVCPAVSVITNVGYDHQAILGDSLAQIARDKAGIARSGRPLLLGPARLGWEDAYAEYCPVVQQRAEELGASFVEVGYLTGPAPEADPFALRIQPDTSELVHATVNELTNLGVVKTAVEVDNALDGFYYRGRLELTQLGGHPVILDAAHNVDSLRFLAGAVKRRFKRKIPVVFGCQASHGPLEMLAEIKGIAEVIIPIAIPVLRPCPVEAIAAAARQLGLPVSRPAPAATSLATGSASFSVGHITELDPPDNSTGWIERVQHALSLATPAAPCLVCGSIYYLGEILRVFEDGQGA